jgi:hypothetical protein
MKEWDGSEEARTSDITPQARKKRQEVCITASLSVLSLNMIMMKFTLPIDSPILTGTSKSSSRKLVVIKNKTE